MVISSPFLRCLQTAQEACRALALPGITINNSVCEILSPGSKMKGPPEVPRADLTRYGIKILESDDNPMPKYPETIQEAIARCHTLYYHMTTPSCYCMPHPLLPYDHPLLLLYATPFITI